MSYSTNNKKYKKCITYGTFDVYHYGHERLLQRISNLCQEVVVGVSSDKFNNIKNKKSFDSEKERIENVKKTGFASKIITEDDWSQKRIDIKKYNVDALIMGDDWKDKFDDLKDICDVVYLPRTEGISSTQIRDEINEKNNI